MIGLLSAVLPSVMEVAGRFLPEDKEKRAAAEREIEAQLTTHLAKIDLAQLDINKTEAAHRSVFVSGWRAGVVCLGTNRASGKTADIGYERDDAGVDGTFGSRRIKDRRKNKAG